MKIKYTVKRIELVTRSIDDKEVILISANNDKNQVIEIYDIELPSVSLGNTIEVTVEVKK